MTETYTPRIIDAELDEYLKTFGFVSISGPARSGKTRTAERLCGSKLCLTDERNGFNNKMLAETDTDLAMKGETPRLIDEWQEVPALWDGIKMVVDHRAKKGQFVITSSFSPKNMKVRNCAAGRVGKLRMATMSLYETGDSDGTVSLEELCEGRINQHLTESKSLDEIAHMIVRGGWPENQGEKDDVTKMPKAYVENLLSLDMKSADGTDYDREKLSLFLKSLARSEGTVSSLKTLQKDISSGAGHDGPKIAESTLSNYADLLKRMYVTENTPGYWMPLRSPARTCETEKLRFCDTSLPCALLGAEPQTLIDHLDLFGKLFESLCVHDLSVYAESFGAETRHYRDYAGHVIDAVIELPDGRWCGFDIELGAGSSAAAADRLLKTCAYIESHGGKKPSSLCVICGLSGAAYRLNNGVFVVPITSLKP